MTEAILDEVDAQDVDVLDAVDGEVENVASLEDQDIEADGGEQEGEAQEVNLDELMARINTLEGNNRNLQLTIDKQGNELGERRAYQRLKEEQAQEVSADPSKFMDEFVANPAEKFQAEMDRRDNMRRGQEMERQQLYAQNIQMVKQRVPNLAELQPTILELAKEVMDISNPTPDMIDEAIRDNPALVVMYGKLAEARKDLAQAKKSGPDMLKRVAKATKKGGSVTGASGQSSNGRQNGIASAQDLMSMSDEDIRASLKKLQT